MARLTSARPSNKYAYPYARRKQTKSVTRILAGLDRIKIGPQFVTRNPGRLLDVENTANRDTIPLRKSLRSNLQRIRQRTLRTGLVNGALKRGVDLSVLRHTPSLSGALAYVKQCFRFSN